MKRQELKSKRAMSSSMLNNSIVHTFHRYKTAYPAFYLPKKKTNNNERKADRKQHTIIAIVKKKRPPGLCIKGLR